MTTFAQGLPVASIPEKLLVATVWNHMIYYRCLHESAFLHALHAQRVCLEEGFLAFFQAAP